MNKSHDPVQRDKKSAIGALGQQQNKKVADIKEKVKSDAEEKKMRSNVVQGAPRQTMEALITPAIQKRQAYLSPKDNLPDLSIIVAVRNQKDYTSIFLADLYRSTQSVFELIVINNGSTDGTDKLLRLYRERFKNITIVTGEKENTVAKSWNMGIKLARCDRMVICNNDILLPTYWDVRMSSCFRVGNKVGVIVPLTNFGSHTQKPQFKGMRFRPETVEQYNQAIQETGKIRSVAGASGFFMMFDRKLIGKIGLFCDKFKVGMYEDNVFYDRVNEAGYQIILDGKTAMWHYGSQTFKGEGINMRELMDSNKIIYDKVKNG